MNSQGAVLVRLLILFSVVCVIYGQACQRPGNVYDHDLPYLHPAKASCNPKPMIYDNEGCKECMYLDTKGIKTIGVGFNLQQSSSRGIIAKVGANYDAIVSGPATPVRTPCNCSRVTCLNREQINQIFDITIEIARADAQSAVSTFASLCCGVQNALVDMSFTLGGPALRSFTTVISLITGYNWKAAGDDLTTTLWCVKQATRRCMNDARAIQAGCGCPGLKPCTGGTACCNTQQTCCKGTLTFKNYITKTFDEMLCCPSGYPVCCPQNTCCSSQYPVCCPPKYCCVPGARCVSGQCVREDGTIAPGIRTGRKTTAQTHENQVEV